MTKLLSMIALIFCVCLVAHADIYMWKDSEGVVHFSDRPHEGATKLKMPDVPSASPEKAKTIDKNDEDAGIVQGQSNYVDTFYTNLDILQPENEATIRNNQGFVLVAVSLKPALRPGDMLQLIFDGAPLGDPQTQTVFQLNNIYRGAHTLEVHVLDPREATIFKSKKITIYMRRPRVGGG